MLEPLNEHTLQAEDLDDGLTLDIFLQGRLDNFGNGFLPASFQGSVFKASNIPVANIKRTESSEKLQKNKLALLRKLDQNNLDRVGREDALESAIALIRCLETGA